MCPGVNEEAAQIRRRVRAGVQIEDADARIPFSDIQRAICRSKDIEISRGPSYLRLLTAIMEDMQLDPSIDDRLIDGIMTTAIRRIYRKDNLHVLTHLQRAWRPERWRVEDEVKKVASQSKDWGTITIDNDISSAAFAAQMLADDLAGDIHLQGSGAKGRPYVSRRERMR